MRRTLLPLALYVLSSDAAKVPFTVHTHTTPRSSSSSLHARADVSGNTNTAVNDTIPVRNAQNTFYVANITLNGATKAVMLDTGRYAPLNQLHCMVPQLIRDFFLPVLICG